MQNKTTLWHSYHLVHLFSTLVCYHMLKQTDFRTQTHKLYPTETQIRIYQTDKYRNEVLSIGYCVHGK